MNIQTDTMITSDDISNKALQLAELIASQPPGMTHDTILGFLLSLKRDEDQRMEHLKRTAENATRGEANALVAAAESELRLKPLRESLHRLFSLVEVGSLVRDTSNDAAPGWQGRALELVAVLAAAQSALAGHVPPDPLVHVREALREYHHALDTRKDGDVAANRFVRAAEAALGAPWVQGATLNIPTTAQVVEKLTI